jgi:scyllo-inositol 2-dehydrogenase (NADP+)
VIRWGVVGVGNISRRFTQGLKHIEGTQLTHVWSRRPAATAQFAAQHGGIACDSFEALLESEVDAVYIATAHTSHAAYSIEAMHKGKAVLSEKPAAVSLVELDRVLAVARETGMLYMEGMKPPFFPLYRRLREHLKTDPIGQPNYVRAGAGVSNLPPGDPALDPERAGGGLLGIGIYEAFLAVDWLGASHEVQTLGRSAGGIDLFASVNSAHEHGIAQWYCGLDLHGRGDALICGPQGNVTIEAPWWNPQCATIAYPGGRKVELDEPFVGGGLNYETEHFCDCLRSGLAQSPEISHEKSRQMITMIDQSRTTLGLPPLGV